MKPSVFPLQTILPVIIVFVVIFCNAFDQTTSTFVSLRFLQTDAEMMDLCASEDTRIRRELGHYAVSFCEGDRGLTIDAALSQNLAGPTVNKLITEYTKSGGPQHSAELYILSDSHGYDQDGAVSGYLMPALGDVAQDVLTCSPPVTTREVHVVVSLETSRTVVSTVLVDPLPTGDGYQVQKLLSNATEEVSESAFDAVLRELITEQLGLVPEQQQGAYAEEGYAGALSRLKHTLVTAADARVSMPEVTANAATVSSAVVRARFEQLLSKLKELVKPHVKEARRHVKELVKPDVEETGRKKAPIRVHVNGSPYGLPGVGDLLRRLFTRSSTILSARPQAMRQGACRLLQQAAAIERGETVPGRFELVQEVQLASSEPAPVVVGAVVRPVPGPRRPDWEHTELLDGATTAITLTAGSSGMLKFRLRDRMCAPLRAGNILVGAVLQAEVGNEVAFDVPVSVVEGADGELTLSYTVERAGRYQVFLQVVGGEVHVLEAVAVEVIPAAAVPDNSVIQLEAREVIVGDYVRGIVLLRDRYNNELRSGGDVVVAVVVNIHGEVLLRSTAVSVDNGSYKIEFKRPTNGEFVIRLSINEDVPSDYALAVKQVGETLPAGPVLDDVAHRPCESNAPAPAPSVHDTMSTSPTTVLSTEPSESVRGTGEEVTMAPEVVTGNTIPKDDPTVSPASASTTLAGTALEAESSSKNSTVTHEPAAVERSSVVEQPGDTHVAPPECNVWNDWRFKLSCALNVLGFTVSAVLAQLLCSAPKRMIAPHTQGASVASEIDVSTTKIIKGCVTETPIAAGTSKQRHKHESEVDAA